MVRILGFTFGKSTPMTVLRQVIFVTGVLSNDPRGAVALTLPATAPAWRLVLDTTRPFLTQELHQARLEIPAQSVFVFEPLHSGGAA